MTQIRDHFPILAQEVNDHQLIYFDNAATTQKPLDVINSITDYYKKYNANVHRGVHELATKATNEYVDAHEKVAKYINSSAEEVIFNSGTTEGLNFIADRVGANILKEGDVVVVTEMEHHSNIIPWQMLVKRKKIKLEWLTLNASDYSIDLDYLDFLIRKYREKLKVVSFTGLSNVLGVRTDVQQIVDMSKSVGAITVLDAAQMMMHGPVDVRQLDVDFVVFSGHKIFGPTGIGVCYGKKELLEEIEPWKGGGEMVGKVWKTGAEWAELPWKFEAGTPNISGGIALGSAIDWVSDKLSWGSLKKHEMEMTKTLLDGLKEISGVKIIGPEEADQREGVVAFTVSGVHAHDLASLLDEEGVAIRAGYHCAEPIHKKLGIGATARASLAAYNTNDEVKEFLRILKEVSGKLK